MGAVFQTMTVDHPWKSEVEKAFREAQERDRHENGHSYSGGFGMASGLVFERRCFDTTDEAFDYLEEAAEKWGPAICVSVQAPNTAQTLWAIGAWCAE